MPRSRTARRWLTVREAAEYSGFATRTIRKRIAEGVLPAYLPRGSRLLRIDGDDLDAMITADGRIPAAHLGNGQPVSRPLTRPRPRKGGGNAA
jgi:excisionase family DNA binding protein